MVIGKQGDVAALFATQVKTVPPYSLFTPKIPPYEHQKKAASEAYENLCKHGFHALFMEMGTGKTKTTLDVWAGLVSEGRSDGLVVVAPKALLSTWKDEEIPKHFPFDVKIHAWNGKSTKKSDLDFYTALNFEGPAVLIINVESFQVVPEAMRDRFKAFAEKRKCLMIVDESSFIKSHDAKRSKNIKAAGKLVYGRMILTGTEITKGPLDLFMQFEFLKPGFWGVNNFFFFRSRYAELVDQYAPGGRTFKKVVGYKRLNELIGRISPYVSRALKKDCLDLPPKVYMDIRVELSPVQRKVYDQLKSSLAAMIGAKILTVPNSIALFTKFRQIPGGMIKIEGENEVIDSRPPKLEALLADLSDTSEQAIIWASFTHEIKMIVDHLSEIAPTVAFYGEEPQELRDRNKKMFQSGEAQFIVINPQCGAFGLNLQNAHIQYFYSRSLRPADNWQAEDRTHRSGQKDTCIYKSIIAIDTVDERIDELLKNRTDIREQLQSMKVQDFIKLV